MERLGCYWFEDPLLPEDHAGYAELSRALDMMVVAGETECNRFQFRDRLAARAVDVILPDICRAGGITEGQKIAILADALPHALGRPRQHGYHGPCGRCAAFGCGLTQFPRLRISSAAPRD